MSKTLSLKKLSNIISLIFFIFIPAFTAAQNKISPPGVAVFSVPNNNNADIALTAETVDRVKRVFAKCGRFVPAPERELEAAYNAAKLNLKAGDNIYLNAARTLDIDLCVLVSAYQLGTIVYSDINVLSLNPEYKIPAKNIKLKSKIKLNIPLKSGIEIAALHKNLPLNTVIANAYGDNTYLINAGEWHGLENNKNYIMDDTALHVIQSGRFESIVKIPQTRKQNDRIQIHLYPDADKIIKELDDDISRNTVTKYELGEPGTGEKKLVEGMCVINMCSNACVPGYGAFLSTGFLGFKDTKPDWPGVALSASFIAAQLLLPELMTDFKINFLPWKQDRDKNENMQDLQKFLWLSLPFTFSAAYMNQLAYQFNSTEHLPPFFDDKDNMSAIFSLLIPGGGHFYKGNRLSGWSFYFSEMCAAGYAVYNYGNSSAKYALYALGAVKLIDIVYAYMSGTSYSFYNFEKERVEEPASFNMGIRTGPDRDIIYTAMVSSMF